MASVGQKLSDRYEIVREIGRGGMGVVFLARDRVLERDVAVKVIPPTRLGRDAEERFRREARIVAKMDHPGIVGIHDFGEDQGSLFLVMPFVEGDTLASLLRSGVLSLEDIVSIGIQVAEALDYSHSRSVAHRDVKPDNVLLSRDEDGTLRARIGDFGIAKLESESGLTDTGAFVGTFAYLSPEQVNAEQVDGRADIYSLGTVLYECFAGRTPFTGPAPRIFLKIVEDPPPPLGVAIDKRLERLIMRCLAKNPEARPQRARTLAESLREILPSLDRTRTITSPGPLPRRRSGSVSPMIGRLSELAELESRLAAAVDGECQFVMIEGEAGVGKTRLLDEVEGIARDRNIRVLHGRTVEEGQAFPYQGFCEAIQEFFRGSHASRNGDFADLAPGLTSLFPVLSEIDSLRQGTTGSLIASPPPSQIEDRTAIFELLARTLIRCASDGPLVLSLEQLHLADVSIDAVEYVVRRLGPTPVLVVATFRPSEVEKRHPLLRMLESFRGDNRFARISLGAFSQDEHRAFLESLTGSTRLEQSVVTSLFRATEGNPYFTKELVRSLVDSRTLVKSSTGSYAFSDTSGITADALPATIQQAIERRIGRLPESLRELLSIASVLGRSFEYRDLQLLAQQRAELEDEVEELVQAGFLEEDRKSRGDALSFSSGVVCDVLYAGLSRRRRRSLHRSAAEELERRYAGRSERVLAQLLHHYTHGDVAEKVVDYGRQLADASLAAFSSDDAIRSCRLVLEFLEDTEDRDSLVEASVREQLGRALRMASEVDSALHEIDRACQLLEAAARGSEVSTLALFGAECAWEGRQIDEAKRWVERGLAPDRAWGNPRDLARLLALGATVANLRGEYDVAREYLERANRVDPEPAHAHDSATTSGGRLVVALTNPLIATHPGATRIVDEVEVFSGVFETLVTSDENGNLRPLLAESWDVLENGRVFRFRLRKGVVLHDGEPLTAADVKASFQDSMQRGYEGLAAAFGAVRGAGQFLSGEADDVEGLRAISDLELEIRLDAPLPIYLALLTDAKAAIARCGEGFPAGSGPFKVVEHAPGKVVLARSEHWRGGSSWVDEVEFRIIASSSQLADGLRSGELDVTTNLPAHELERLMRDRRMRVKVVEAPRKSVYFALFNTASPFGGSLELRRALSGVLRTRDVVREKLGRSAQPAEGMFPPGVLGHDPSRRRQPLSLDEARELVVQTGLPTPIKLRASVHPVLQSRFGSLLEAVLAAWAQLGVEVTIVTQSLESFLEADSNTSGIDLVIGRYIADYDDPDNFTHRLFNSHDGVFRGYYTSPEFDRLAEDARSELQPGARLRIYERIESMLLEDAVVLPLFHDLDVRVAGPAVRGLAFSGNAGRVNYAEIVKAASGAPAVSSKRGGTIRLPIAGSIANVDAATSYNVLQSDVLSAIFENLTREATGARIAPWLANYEIEDGGSRYRFKLRGDVRFHDGRRLTARDVRYSFERLLQLGDAGTNRQLLSSIRGAAEVLRGEVADLEGFRILSDYEFRVDLDRPLSVFPALLAHTPAAIVPEGCDTFDGTWRDGCVGTGPFRIARFEPGERLELEPNPYYWREGFPKSDGLVFHFGLSAAETLDGFRSGKYSLAWDLNPQDVESLRQDASFASGYGETPRLSTYYIALNTKRGPLEDEQTRRRLVASAGDLDGLVRRSIGRLAIPAHGLIPPGLLGYEAARDFVRRGFESHGPDIELTCMVHSIFEGPYSGFLRELFESFEEKGIKVRIVETQAENYTKHQSAHTVDLDANRWMADYPDTDGFLYPLLHTKSGMFGPYCGTAEVDGLMERARSEPDADARHEIYHDVEERIAKQALMLPLFHEQAYRFARPEIGGFAVQFSSAVVEYANLYVR